MTAMDQSREWTLPYYQANIGEEEEETLQNIDTKWRVHRWLQLAVQGITDEEVPWFELVASPQGWKALLSTCQASHCDMEVESAG